MTKINDVMSDEVENRVRYSFSYERNAQLRRCSVQCSM